MDKRALMLSRIDERLKALKISDRAASLKAGLGVDFVRDLRRFGHSPKVEKLVALSGVLQVPPDYLLGVGEKAGSASRPLADISVRGAIEADSWQQAAEWGRSDWYEITLPLDQRYIGARRHGLEVRDNSCNQIYPEGSIVIVISFDALKKTPVSGNHVIVSKKNRQTSLIELTIREYELDSKNRHVLWPRTAEAELYTPIVLPQSLLLVRSNPLPDASNFDLLVSGLVVASYRLE
jgi:transcriptional regulator with XRE-family HTH domain